MLLAHQLTFLNNSSLKLIAFISSVLVWSIFHETHYTVRTLNVPVCFYNVHNNSIIKAPEYTQVTLRGMKQHMRALDWKELALHINAASLVDGINSVEITSKHLLLPQKIKMVNYNPVHILLTHQTA